MDNLEKKIVNILTDLKENYGIVGVKAEFEDEGTRLEEALWLRKIATKANLDLTIKIGGCGAIKDIYDAKTAGANTIVAPMIETPYALKKFVQATNFVFSDEERQNIKFLINIETITGYSNIKEIIKSGLFSDINGIVLGRDDMTSSMGFSKNDINCDKILEIAKSLSLNMQSVNKDMVIGGSVSADSLKFFDKLPYLTKFETRKIVFDAQKVLKNPDIVKGILKAVSFELLWLKNKRELCGITYKGDEARLQMLENRYKTLIDETSAVSVSI